LAKLTGDLTDIFEYQLIDHSVSMTQLAEDFLTVRVAYGPVTNVAHSMTVMLSRILTGMISFRANLPWISAAFNAPQTIHGRDRLCSGFEDRLPFNASSAATIDRVVLASIAARTL